MDKTHILVVDDEVNTLGSMEFILQARDYEVSLANDGAIALNTILKAKDTRTPIDLLIMDIQMPVVNGLKLIDHLHKLKIELPILIITGYGNHKLYSELARKGCNHVLDKPISEDDLIDKVQTILNHHCGAIDQKLK